MDASKGYSAKLISKTKWKEVLIYVMYYVSSNKISFLDNTEMYVYDST